MSGSSNAFQAFQPSFSHAAFRQDAAGHIEIRLCVEHDDLRGESQL
jgi:hypothetical protein